MSSQLVAATIRALYGGILTAALTFLTTYQLGRGSAYQLEDAALAGGITLLGYMIARGIAEGLIDTNRQANGQVSKSDVGGKQLLSLVGRDGLDKG